MIKLKGKRGSWLDMIYLSIILLGLSITIIVGLMVLNNIRTSFEGNSGIDSTGVGWMNELEGKYVKVFDGIFLFVMIGVTLAALVGAFMIRSHPAFFWVFFILLIIMVVLNAIFSNVYDDIADTSTFKN